MKRVFATVLRAAAALALGLGGEATRRGTDERRADAPADGARLDGRRPQEGHGGSGRILTDDSVRLGPTGSSTKAYVLPEPRAPGCFVQVQAGLTLRRETQQLVWRTLTCFKRRGLQKMSHQSTRGRCRRSTHGLS